jgi:hypothetical protein
MKWRAGESSSGSVGAPWEMKRTGSADMPGASQKSNMGAPAEDKKTNTIEVRKSIPDHFRCAGRQ